MADIVGYLALALMVYGLVRKDHKFLLPLICAGVSLWAVHYWLLGSASGAIVHAIAAAGVFLAHLTYRSRLSSRLGLAAGFALLGVVASLYDQVNVANAVAAVGCVVMTSSQYVLRGAKMRQGFLAGETIFFAFALLVGSVPGMLVTIANFVAGVIGLFRLYKAGGPQAAFDSA